MLVAFWGEYHGQLGTTTNTVALATYMAINYDLKILLTHSQFEKSNMENAFFNHEDEYILNFEDTGIDAIVRLIKTGQLKAEDIHNYSRTFLNDRLDFLTGSTSPIRVRDEIKYLPNVFKVAKDHYNFIFVDVSSGLQNEMTKEIINTADLIVINLNQNKKVLNSYFNSLINHFKEKDTVIVLGRYDSMSRYTPKFIKRHYKYPGEIFTVPYDTGLLDSINEHNLLDYFIANQGDGADESYLFFELDRLCKYVLDRAEIEESMFRVPITRKHLIARTAEFLKKQIV